MANEDTTAPTPWIARLATPAQWFVAAVVVQAAAWFGPLAFDDERASRAPDALQDTYYVVVHPGYWLGLASAMVVIAALYLLLDSLVRAPRRGGLRRLHLGLALGGNLLILSPPIALKLTGMSRRYEDFGAAFALWNWVATIGYALTLAGLVVFAVVVLDAIRNRRQSRKPSPA